MREYKIAKGWAIATYVFVPLLIALFAALPFLTYEPGKENWIASFAFVIAVSLGMIALMLIGLLDAIKSRFIIDDTSVTSQTLFSRRTLLFTEIKGYRATDKFMLIEPAVAGKKRIRVSQYLGGYKEIKQWLADHFDDVDVLTKQEEEKEILSNTAFGFTDEERSAKLQSARKLCRVLNAIGLIIGFWLFIYPTPYLYALAAGLAMPWIALMVTKAYKGLIHINESKGSAYPSLLVAILIPALGVMLRALFDYNVYSYEHVWLPAFAITGVFIFLLCAGSRELLLREKKSVFIVLFLFVFVFGYSYGAVVTTNCYFDTSVPKEYGASVLSKRVSTGKHTSYYLTLSAWGNQTEADEVDVARDLYDEVVVNDAVEVYYMNGAFDIPWFEVSK